MKKKTRVKAMLEAIDIVEKELKSEDFPISWNKTLWSWTAAHRACERSREIVSG